MASKFNSIVGAGSTAADATALTSQGAQSGWNVTSTPSGSGVMLPGQIEVPTHILINNLDSSNALKVYPQTGGTVDGGASYSLSASTAKTFWAISPLDWIHL